METYDFSEKAKYRSRVWCEIEKQCKIPKWLRRAVYLDTREALETKFLLARGYNPANLLAVNRDPVEVALLTAELKRSRLPTVATAGVEWQRAIRERLHPSGAHIINFDGMGCLHIDLINLVRQSIQLSGARVVAVNMLGGREPRQERIFLAESRQFRERSPENSLPSVTTFGRRVNRNHAERVRALIAIATGANSHEKCWAHVTSLSWDVYQSASGQPMVWCVARVDPHSDCDTAWRKVERQFCVAPSCVYLSDPDSFRSLNDRRDRLIQIAHDASVIADRLVTSESSSDLGTLREVAITALSEARAINKQMIAMHMAMGFSVETFPKINVVVDPDEISLLNDWNKSFKANMDPDVLRTWEQKRLDVAFQVKGKPYAARLEIPTGVR